MMHRNPLKRSTALQVMHDKWMMRLAPRPSGLQLQDSFVQHLKDFQTQNLLRKATLSIIAGQLRPEQVRALRAIFSQLDRNGNGQVSREELQISLEQSGIPKSNSDLDEIMRSMDTNSNGTIDWTEFVA